MNNSSTEPKWLNCIPRKQRLKIGKAVMKQFSMLPSDLLSEWMTAKPIEENWFIKASEFIDIPYFDQYFTNTTQKD